jgi:ADP-ribose pyrophosphatase YjhB (NUDIX family)
LDKS